MTSIRRGCQLDRRTLLKVCGAGMATTALLGAGALASPATPQLHTDAAPDLTMRTIPGTDERLPAIGLGTFLTFDAIPGQVRSPLRQVMETYWNAGLRVIDTAPLYGTAETTVGDYATALSISDQAFFATKVWATGDFLADEGVARNSLMRSKDRLWRERIDLVQCHNLINVDIILPYLKIWKKEGHIRYTGVSHFENFHHPILLDRMVKGKPDFIQVNYSIFNRKAEEQILPAAAQEGIAVLTNMPFEKARLFEVVAGHEVPAFARDAGMQTWAEFFLKWVISHPSVTTALPSTSDPAHASENVLSVRGPLPDPDMRAQMVRHMESIAGFDQIATMPWYPRKSFHGIIQRSQNSIRERI